MNGLPRMRDSREYLPFALQFIKSLFIKDVTASGTFDFAQIDDIVCAVDDKVDLRSFRDCCIGFVNPSAGISQNPANLQSVLDLRI